MWRAGHTGFTAGALPAIISMAQCAGAHSRGPLTIARHAMGCQPSVI